jgi:polar amino acid transport system substrate-binding protein
MKRQQVVFLILSFWLLFSTVALASDTIVFGVDPTKPPMQYLDERGEMVGFEIDLIKQMGVLGGFTPIFKKVAWQELFNGLQEGQFDAACASISITEQRQEQMRFSAPYYRIAQAVLSLPDSGIKVVSDLTGKKVGVKTGTTSQVAIAQYPKVTPVEFSDIIGAVKALYAHEIDAVLCDGPVAGYYAVLDQKKENHVEIVFVLEGARAEMYGIAVNTANREMQRILNRALQLVQKNNKDIELQRKWFSGLLQCQK